MELFSIGLDFEGAAARWNQGKRFDSLAEFEDFRRQTDGFRRVVSNHAVFNRDFSLHVALLSTNETIGRLLPVKSTADSQLGRYPELAGIGEIPKQRFHPLVRERPTDCELIQAPRRQPRVRLHPKDRKRLRTTA
jgi:hypothetical protein